MNKLLLFISLFLTITGSSAAIPGFVDSLKIELNRHDINDTSKARIYLQLSYHSLNNPTEAFEFCNKAIEHAKKTNQKEFEAYAYGYLGEIEGKLGNHSKSIDALIMSANTFRKLHKAHHEAYALGAIGVTFMREGDLVNATKYYNQSLQLFNEHNDTASVANTLLNIGEAYRVSEFSDSAMSFCQQGIDIIELYSDRKNPKIEKCYATLKGNIGLIHLQNGQFDVAEDKLNSAVSYFKLNKDFYRWSVYQNGLGKLHILKGDTKKGEALVKESLELAKRNQMKEQIRDFSLDLSLFYERRKNTEKALNYYKQYKIYDDSLKNIETVRKIEQQQSQFQLSKKEEEITILNRINKLQRNLAFVLSASVLAFIVLIFILFQANSKIKLTNKLLNEQKLIIETREKEKALLLRELNHRVKNNLQMVSSLLNLHARQLKDHPAAAEALLAGRYRVEALTLIHQKLYRDDVDTKIDIKDYIHELSKNLVQNFGPEFILTLDLESFAMKIDKAIPLGLIINELVTNSLKYGGLNNNEPLLKISIKNYKNEVLLCIRDNGQGLPNDFDLTKSTSFGLKLVNSLVRQLGGSITYQKEEGAFWSLKLDKSKIV